MPELRSGRRSTHDEALLLHSLTECPNQKQSQTELKNLHQKPGRKRCDLSQHPRSPAYQSSPAHQHSRQRPHRRLQDAPCTRTRAGAAAAAAKEADTSSPHLLTKSIRTRAAATGVWTSLFHKSSPVKAAHTSSKERKTTPSFTPRATRGKARNKPGVPKTPILEEGQGQIVEDILKINTQEPLDFPALKHQIATEKKKMDEISAGRSAEKAVAAVPGAADEEPCTAPLPERVSVVSSL